VVLKSGRSAAGIQVASTHTAALASDDRIWTSVLAAHGAVRVDSTEALVDALACGVSVPPSASFFILRSIFSKSRR
jgi:acyl-CoA synthetase (NDP forming)